MYKLGRITVKDLRDENYLIQLASKKNNRKKRYWNQNGWWGNQDDTSECIGYGFAHFLEDGPITHGGKPPIVDPHIIYTEARKIDEYPGEDYDGTTVRAGAKYLKSLGLIVEYRWGYDLPTLISTILNVGPVVVGTWWFDDMYEPDRDGFIHVSGKSSGGHCYICNGVNIPKKKFRIKNSWGRDWGVGGSAYVSFDDMENLIKWDGEVCLALESR